MSAPAKISISAVATLTVTLTLLWTCRWLFLAPCSSGYPYFLLIAVYPFVALLAATEADTPGIAFFLAIVQYPVYGFLFGRAWVTGRLQPAIVSASAALVVMHNHPSGEATPSEADIRVTRALSGPASFSESRSPRTLVFRIGADTSWTPPIHYNTRGPFTLRSANQAVVQILLPSKENKVVAGALRDYSSRFGELWRWCDSMRDEFFDYYSLDLP